MTPTYVNLQHIKKNLWEPRKSGGVGPIGSPNLNEKKMGT